jgi:hypothetical protein
MSGDLPPGVTQADIDAVYDYEDPEPDELDEDDEPPEDDDGVSEDA